MKTNTSALTIVFIILFANCAAAQQGSSNPEIFRIGSSKTVVIPSPAGFVNGHPGIPQVAAQVAAFEDPQGRTLTMHIPHDVAVKIRAGEKVEMLGFYAKISVHNDTVNVDVTPALFADLVANVEKNFETLVDESLPEAEESGRRALSEYLGRQANVRLARPIYLGSFDKRPNVATNIALTFIVENGKRRMPMLGALSYVIVNKRILYVSTYREFKADQDVEILRNFTKKWVNEILEANG